MADFQHWRRMINPSKGRNSSNEHDDVIPTSPKRASKPRFSTHLNQQVSSSPDLIRREACYDAAGSSVFNGETLIWKGVHAEAPTPVHLLVEHTMQRLLSSPLVPLDLRYHSTILRICEGYRYALHEQQSLQRQLEEQSKSHNAIMQGFQQAQKRWHEEEQEYKLEVKRLEVLIAKGKRGLAEVTLARQESLLRHRRQKIGNDGLETVFEFLEKDNKTEDKGYEAQRATFTKRKVSPSAVMARLSQTLTNKKSMTSIHADLPFGPSPSGVHKPRPLPALRRHSDKNHTDTDSSEPRTSMSDDTYSTFSCAGDLLPNETSDGTLVDIMDDDVACVKHTTERLARRREMDASVLLPRILELFDIPNDNSEAGQASNEKDKRSVSAPNALMLNVPEVKAAVLDRMKPTTKQPSMIQKASGFITRKLKPIPLPPTTLRASTDALVTPRRFSFETGDDVRSITLFTAEPGTLENAVLNNYNNLNIDAQLRRSASMSSLPTPRANATYTNGPCSPLALPPPQTSPTASTTSTSRRTSRIPNPLHNKRTIPRQEREDSSSSLLTVIRHSPHARSLGRTSTLGSIDTMGEEEEVAEQGTATWMSVAKARPYSVMLGNGTPPPPFGQGMRNDVEKGLLKQGRSETSDGVVHKGENSRPIQRKSRHGGGT